MRRDGSRMPVLSGRYRLHGELGRGAMGSVWSADDLLLDERVAVKIIEDGMACHPENLGRFRREACALTALESLTWFASSNTPNTKTALTS